MSPHEHKSKPRLDELYTNESRSKRVFGRTRMNRFRNLRELATAMMFWSQSEPEALPGTRLNDVIKRDQESMTITTFFLMSELFSCSPRNRSQTGFFGLIFQPARFFGSDARLSRLRKFSAAINLIWWQSLAQEFRPRTIPDLPLPLNVLT